MNPESYVLSRMVQSKKDRALLSHKLTPSFFEGNSEAKTVFQLMSSFNGSGLTIEILYDQVSSSSLKLARKKRLFTFLGGLSSTGQVTSSEAAYYVSSLERQAKDNLIYQGLTEANKRFSEGDMDGAVTTVKRYFDQAQSLHTTERTVTTKSISSLCPDSDTEVFNTGFQELDRVTGGARKTEFWIWGAYPGEFKSTALLSIAHSLMLEGKNSFFCSLEMTLRELQRRLICLHSMRVFETPIPFREIELESERQKKSWQAYKRASEDFDRNEKYGEIFVFHPPTGVNIDDIMFEFEALNDRSACDVILLDYAQKLRPIRERGQPRVEFTETVDRIKHHALNSRSREGALIFSAWQISREGRKFAEEHEYYRMFDLSESTGVEQAANVIAWSLYTREFENRHEVKVGLSKSRNSTTKGSAHFLPTNMAYGFLGQVPVESETVDIGEIEV